MLPAFQSNRAALFFGTTVLFLLSLPWLAAHHFISVYQDDYSRESLRFERFPWCEQFVLREQSPLDIALVGSSRLWFGIDTPYLQAALEKNIRKKAEVRTIGFPGPGYDCVYTMIRELVKHRQVREVIIYDEPNEGYVSEQRFAPFWYREGDWDELRPVFPLKEHLAYYCAAVVGMPRYLWAAASVNKPMAPWTVKLDPASWNSPNPENALGCLQSPVALDPGPRIRSETSRRPVDLRPILLSNSNSDEVLDLQDGTSPNQTYFAYQIGELAKKYHFRLIVLHMPSFDERSSDKIVFFHDWRKILGQNVPILAVKPSSLFANMTDGEIAQMFADRVHLNARGQKYFTSVITPFILAQSVTKQ